MEGKVDKIDNKLLKDQVDFFAEIRQVGMESYMKNIFFKSFCAFLKKYK